MNDWRSSPMLKRITTKSVERIATLFEVTNLAYSVGGITNKMMIDQETVERVIAVMVEQGILEKIETNFVPYYRKVGKVR